MTRVPAPEDAFQLALERPGSDESASELVALAMHLRTIGTEIQAPDGLRAGRDALLALGSGRGVARRPLLGWRRARAVLVAAVLTMLTVVGVAAATLADRWLDVTGDENGTVPLIVPSPRESDDEQTDGSATDPSPTVFADGLTNAGSDDDDDAHDDEEEGDKLDDPEDVGDADDDGADGSDADDDGADGSDADDDGADGSATDDEDTDHDEDADRADGDGTGSDDEDGTDAESGTEGGFGGDGEDEGDGESADGVDDESDGGSD